MEIDGEVDRLQRMLLQDLQNSGLLKGSRFAGEGDDDAMEEDFEPSQFADLVGGIAGSSRDNNNSIELNEFKERFSALIWQLHGILYRKKMFGGNSTDSPADLLNIEDTQLKSRLERMASNELPPNGASNKIAVHSNVSISMLSFTNAMHELELLLGNIKNEQNIVAPELQQMRHLIEALFVKEFKHLPEIMIENRVVLQGLSLQVAYAGIFIWLRGSWNIEKQCKKKTDNVIREIRYTPNKMSNIEIYLSNMIAGGGKSFVDTTENLSNILMRVFSKGGTNFCEIKNNFETNGSKEVFDWLDEQNDDAHRTIFSSFVMDIYLKKNLLMLECESRKLTKYARTYVNVKLA